MFRHAFVISTPLLPAEAASRLSTVIGPPVPLLRVFRGNRTYGALTISNALPFTGEVTPESFSASPTRVVRGVIPPRVTGSVSAFPDHSVVAVTVAPSLGELLLLAVASVLLGGLGVHIFFLADTVPEFRPIAAGLLAIAVLPWPLTAAASRTTARSLKVRLSRLLDEERPEA